MNLPLALVEAYVYSPTAFVYGVYVRLTFSVPIPVATLLLVYVVPLVHV